MGLASRGSWSLGAITACTILASCASNVGVAKLSAPGPAAIETGGVFVWNRVALPAVAPSKPDQDPSVAPSTPSRSSAEYQRNWGLAAINPDRGYSLGATGKGVTVAVVDTGFDRTNPDMRGAYSADSVDIVDGRDSLLSFDRHGSGVAGVVASRFDNRDTVGVAYESTILGIRADATAAGARCEGSCRFNAADLAKAVDYAAAKGAEVINISLANYATDPAQSAAFEAALSRATAAGLVLTVAASNSGEDSPALHARYAADRRYAGAFLAIGALGADGSMASFSNRAGATKDSYLTAPGVDIVTDCNAAGSCERASGTSFAAPHVAGALAMLLQHFPDLSGRDAVAILLRTADDKGDPGTDVVYGRGALNLTRAFQPVGSQTLALADGGTVALSGGLGSSLGFAFGDAVNGDLTTIIHDDYQRPFVVDLAQNYARRQRMGVLLGAQPPARDVAQTFGLPAGAVLTLTAQTPMFETSERDASPVRAFLRPEDASSTSASVRMAAPGGSLHLTAWRGRGATAAPSGVGGRNAFATLAAADRAVVGVWRAGSFAIGGEGGWAERRTGMSIVAAPASTYAAASAAWLGRAFTISLSGGALSEPRGALGSELTPGSPLALPARTRFAAVALDRRLGALTLRAEAAMGRTTGDGRLVDIDEAMSSSWRLALRGACDDALPCQDFGVEIAQPLRVESGAFRALLPTVVETGNGSIFTERRFSASPKARELDLRLNTDARFGGGTLRLEAAAAFDPAHQTVQAELAVSAGWRTQI